MRESAVDAVAALGPATVQKAAPLLEDTRWEVREAVLQVLSRVPLPDITPALLLRLSDPNHRVVRAATSAISKLAGIIRFPEAAHIISDLQTRLKDMPETITVLVTESYPDYEGHSGDDWPPYVERTVEREEENPVYAALMEAVLVLQRVVT